MGKVRVIPAYEKKKRGCQYCLDHKCTRYFNEYRTVCIHNECQYPVLDKHETYEEFMDSEDSKALLAQFFTDGEVWCSLTKSSKRSNMEYGDSDW